VVDQVELALQEAEHLIRVSTVEVADCLAITTRHTFGLAAVAVLVKQVAQILFLLVVTESPTALQGLLFYTPAAVEVVSGEANLFRLAVTVAVAVVLEITGMDNLLHRKRVW
jgi:hypothetical protein